MMNQSMAFLENKFPPRYIELHTVFRDGAQTKTIPIRFPIVDAPSS